MGVRGGAVGCGTALRAGPSRLRLGVLSNLNFPPKMALGSTQPVTENEYQAFLLKSKSGRCVRLTTLQRSRADCLEILGDSNSWSRKV